MVMARRGIDLSGHRSRHVTQAMLERADLVLGMTRDHVWGAALLDPEVLSRAFVLGELVRINTAAGGRDPGEKFADWIDRLHGVHRYTLNSIVESDEVLDPFNRRARYHERAARRIEGRVLQLIDCAFDPAVPDRSVRWTDGKLVWRP